MNSDTEQIYTSNNNSYNSASAIEIRLKTDYLLSQIEKQLRGKSTIIVEEEVGTSLRAAGWKCLHKTAGGSWSCKSRPRVDKHPTQKKWYWAIEANG